MRKILLIFIILTARLVLCSAQERHTVSELMCYQIQIYEGCRETPDSKHQIGYGHKMSPSEHFDSITVAVADSLFALDVYLAERGANWLLEDAEFRGIVPQPFFDALVSLVYSVGYSNLKKTEFFARLCRCRYRDGVVDESDWNWTLKAILDILNYDEGHARRRQNEYTIARFGRYEAF